MPKVTSQPKSAGTNVPKGACKSSGVEEAGEGRTCILCYLVKEGVKKACTGIKGLRSGRTKSG